MAPALLLLLLLLRLALAQDSDPARESREEHVVILRGGAADSVVSSRFTLSAAPPSLPIPANVTIAQDSRAIATAAKIQNVTAGASPTEVIINFHVTFAALPGLATVLLKAQDTDPDKTWLSATHVFHVIGVALYRNTDSPTILTGRNAPPLQFPPTSDDSPRELTVKAAVYAGTGLLQRSDLALSVTPSRKSPLPWHRGCGIAAPPSKLGETCAMAFSPDFTAFTLRVPPSRSLTTDLTIAFTWPGLEEIDNQRTAATTGSPDPDGPPPTPSSLRADPITTARLTPQRAPSPGPASGITTTATTTPDPAPAPRHHIPAWKIALIVVTIVIATNVLCTLIYCFLRGRKPAPDGKVLTKEIVHKGDQFGFRSFFGKGEYVHECYVEEPSSSHGGSTILMLEHEGSAAAQGLAALDGLGEDKSVDRLVLPRAVVRGVDLRGVDFESGADGAGSNKLGPLSSENDVTTYGRGMTAVPRVRHRADSREDRNTQRDIDLEEPQASNAAGGRGGKERGRGTGGAGGAKKVVGSAMNRIRQVDLLQGPHTKGIIGRNGEPIQPREEDDEGEFAKGIAPFSRSTLS